MKRFLSAILLLVYFAVSTGFVVSRHYCMGRMDSIQLGSSDDDRCGKCGMHKAVNECCRDEVSIYRLDNEHFTTKLIFHSPVAPDAPIAAISFFAIPFRNAASLPLPPESEPPPDTRGIHLQNCVFRI